MCGRYRLSRRKQLVAEYFDALPDDQDWILRYNKVVKDDMELLFGDLRQETLDLRKARVLAREYFWDFTIMSSAPFSTSLIVPMGMGMCSYIFKDTKVTASISSAIPMLALLQRPFRRETAC